MTPFRSGRAAFAACAALLLSAGAGRADMTYGFTNITGNNAANAATGVAQLKVEVQDLGGSNVGFLFTNSGPNASSITQIYFDDGTLLDIASITSSAGVDYEEQTAAGNLPGGNPYDFNPTKGFTVEPAPPTQPNGINPGEWLLVKFTLKSGQTYADTIAALNKSLDPANFKKDVVGGLRIGFHVQGYSNGGSEAFINGGGSSNPPPPPPPPPAVPAPAGVLLAFVGMGALAARRRMM